jgi:hypothetical protein
MASDVMCCVVARSCWRQSVVVSYRPVRHCALRPSRQCDSRVNTTRVMLETLVCNTISCKYVLAHRGWKSSNSFGASHRLESRCVMKVDVGVCRSYGRLRSISVERKSDLHVQKVISRRSGQPRAALSILGGSNLRQAMRLLSGSRLSEIWSYNADLLCAAPPRQCAQRTGST